MEATLLLPLIVDPCEILIALLCCRRLLVDSLQPLNSPCPWDSRYVCTREVWSLSAAPSWRSLHSISSCPLTVVYSRPFD